MHKFFEEQYYLFLSQPVVSGAKHCREVTAACLFVLSDYILLSKGEYITRQETAQEIFKLLETKILTNEELVRFDKAVDLFGQVIRGEIRVRGDWCFLNDEVSNGLQRVFLCYGDLIYNPDYIEDYENSPVFITDITDAIDFRSQFVKIQELYEGYIKKCNNIVDELLKEKFFSTVELCCQVKKVLAPMEIEEDIYKDNLEYCHGNMSIETLKELKSLLEEYLCNYSILMPNNSYNLDVLKKIACIFESGGYAKFNNSIINGKRISIELVCNSYIAVLLYEKIALLGEYEAYIEAANLCANIRKYDANIIRKKTIVYYNRAAEKGVLKAYRYCDYMPEVFDKLIKEKGPKYYIAYFFMYSRQKEYKKCKMYLKLIKEQCSEKDKKEVVRELGCDYQGINFLAFKYLNGETKSFRPKKNVAGCYIATCVYGSYDCPEVWTLRRYRDNMLGSSWYGRSFIKLYYAISPTIVKWFGKTKWFRRMWKNKLDKMVEKLQNRGVESFPYQDKNWKQIY